MATVYSFLIPIKGRLDLIDAIAFITIFAFYMRAASKGEHVEPELEGPPAMIEGWGEGARRLFTVLFFLFSGYTIFIAANRLPKDCWLRDGLLALRNSSWFSGSRL
jgi:cation:H+ antiporter